MFKPSCNYAQLGNYNNMTGSNNYNTPMMSVPQATGSSKATNSYVVPAWGQPGYATLMHSQQEPSCSGYFNIGSAYPGAGKCSTKYVQSMCQ